MVDGELRLWRSWCERSDGDAFGALVRPHVEFASRLARRSGLAAADADDVVQRSLIRLAAERSEKPVRVGLRAWLGRSVLNEARMFFRGRRRREGHEAMAPIRIASESPRIESRDEVERALAELDLSARRVVELRYFDDLEYREIAFVEGGSALGARLRVHRALKRLRARLGHGAALSIAALAADQPTSASADAVIARCLGSVEAGRATGIASATSSSVGGGLVVGMSAKLGIAALAAGLVGAGFFVLRRADPTPTPPRVETASTSAAAPESAPTILAAPARVTAPPPLLEPVAGEPPAAPAEPKAVPLDVPIPPGKGSVSGVLTFDDGKPFAHAKVALWGTPQVTAETDDEGKFHIHGDWVGDRDLTLLGTDGSVVGLAPVEMVADTRVAVEITIIRGVTVSGTVSEAVTLTPIVGAKVKVRRPGAHSKNSMQAGFCFGASDAEGQFRFEHVPGATYHLEVAAPGHQADGRDFVVARDDPKLDVQLAVARVLTVRLTNAPVAAIGTTVQWMIQSDGSAPSGSNFSLKGKAVLAAPGELRLDAPPPGEYELTLFEGKFLPRLEKSLKIADGVTAEVTIAVPAGASIDGTLLGRDGKPISGTPVRVGESPVVRTDAAGRFRIEQAASGKQPIWIGGGLGSLSLRVGEVDVGASGASAVIVTAPGSASISLKLVRPGDMGLVMLSTADA